MKKKILLCLFIFIFIPLLFSIKKNLTLNEPSGGSLEIGSYSDITWTYTGITEPVALILYQNDRRVGNIARDLPVGNKKYRWKVGQYSGGTATPGGGYKVVIRVQRGRIHGASNRAFTLTQTLRDIKINGLDTSDSGKLVALTQCNLNDYNGNLKIKISSTGLGETNINKRVNLRRGRETTLELIPVQPYDGTLDTQAIKRYTVYLDYSLEIPETNDSNNLLTAPVRTTPTYAAIVSPIEASGEAVLRIHHGGGTYNIQRKHCYNANDSKKEAYLFFNVDLENQGYKPISSGRLKVTQTGTWAEGGSRLGGGALPRHRTATRADVSVPLGAKEKVNDYTVQVTLKRVNSQVKFEYIWDEPGYHGTTAILTFNATFNHFNR